MLPAPRSSGHPRQAGSAAHLRHCTLLSIEHHATNNLGSQAAELLGLTDIEFETPGAFTVTGSGHAFLGGGSQAASIEALPVGKINEAPNDVELHYQYDDLSPVVGAPYKVTFGDGTVRQGSLDASGYALLSAVPKGVYKVEYGEDSRPWKAPLPKPDDAEFEKTKVQADGRAAIERMLANDPAPAEIKA